MIRKRDEERRREQKRGTEAMREKVRSLQVKKREAERDY